LTIKPPVDALNDESIAEDESLNHNISKPKHHTENYEESKTE
jgi:hypothetical protein